jgi:hypothetical protein
MQYVGYIELDVYFEGDVNQEGWEWTIWHWDGTSFPVYAAICPHFWPFLRRLGRDGWDVHEATVSAVHLRCDRVLVHLRKPTLIPIHRWLYIVISLTRSTDVWMITAVNGREMTHDLPWQPRQERLIRHGWSMVAIQCEEGEKIYTKDIIFKKQYAIK